MPEGRLPDVSVIVPPPRWPDITGEELERLSAELARLGKTFEFIVVLGRDRDGATDWRGRSLRNLVLIEVGGTVNEATALMVGFERARGDLVITLTGFPQVEAESVGAALRVIEEDQADLVVGWRNPRHGSLANRLQSRAYHRLVSWFTGTHFHDLGCGFRVMRRAVALELDLYGSLHRFVPLLAENLGLRVEEVQVSQFRGDRPHGIHGIAAISTGLLDGLTVLFLTKFTRRPLRFFGVIGLLLAAGGAVILVYLALYRLLQYGGIADRPLLLLGVLLTVMGVQSISIGLLGEIIIFTHARKLRAYRVLREISFPYDADGDGADTRGETDRRCEPGRG